MEDVQSKCFPRRDMGVRIYMCRSSNGGDLRMEEGNHNKCFQHRDMAASRTCHRSHSNGGDLRMGVVQGGSRRHKCAGRRRLNLP